MAGTACGIFLDHLEEKHCIHCTPRKPDSQHQLERKKWTGAFGGPALLKGRPSIIMFSRMFWQIPSTSCPQYMRVIVTVYDNI